MACPCWLAANGTETVFVSSFPDYVSCLRFVLNIYNYKWLIFEWNVHVQIIIFMLKEKTWMASTKKDVLPNRGLKIPATLRCPSALRLETRASQFDLTGQWCVEKSGARFRIAPSDAVKPRWREELLHSLSLTSFASTRTWLVALPSQNGAKVWSLSLPYPSPCYLSSVSHNWMLSPLIHQVIKTPWQK